MIHLIRVSVSCSGISTRLLGLPFSSWARGISLVSSRRIRRDLAASPGIKQDESPSMGIVDGDFAAIGFDEVVDDAPLEECDRFVYRGRVIVDEDLGVDAEFGGKDRNRQTEKRQSRDNSEA